MKQVNVEKSEHNKQLEDQKKSFLNGGYRSQKLGSSVWTIVIKW